MAGATQPTTITARTGRVTAPTAVTNVRRIRAPRVSRSSKNGDVVVEHEEFIQEVNGSVAFTNSKLAINPGLYLTFPWLSRMAPMYESYTFEALEFSFQPESATTATGSVMLAMDYDSSDAAASSKTQLAAYRGYIRSAPWAACKNTSSREDLKKRTTYYVRTGTLSANEDIKLYDVGFLNLATNGQANTAVVGELYVRYRVKFSTPQLDTLGLGSALYAKTTFTSLADVGTYAGNAPLVLSGTGAAATLTAASALQALVSVEATGTGLVNVAASGTSTQIAEGSIANAGQTFFEAIFIVTFTAGQTFILTPTATTVTNFVIRVAQYAAALS